MKVFCYFVEPASYSLDLAKNVHDKNNIDYCVGYFAVMKKNGEGHLKRHEVSLFRKIRDFTFIYLYKIFNRY